MSTPEMRRASAPQPVSPEKSGVSSGDPPIRRVSLSPDVPGGEVRHWVIPPQRQGSLSKRLSVDMAGLSGKRISLVGQLELPDVGMSPRTGPDEKDKIAFKAPPSALNDGTKIVPLPTETAKGDQLLVHVKRTDMPSESLQRTIRIADSAVQRGGWDNEIAARIKKKMDRTFRHDSPCAAPASAARASAACARRTHRVVRASR